MNGMERLTRILDSAGDVQYVEQIGERHLVVTFLDGLKMLVELSATEQGSM